MSANTEVSWKLFGGVLLAIFILVGSCYWTFARNVPSRTVTVQVRAKEYVPGNSAYRQRVGNTQLFASASEPRYKITVKERGDKRRVFETYIPADVGEDVGIGDVIKLSVQERGIPVVWPIFRARYEAKLSAKGRKKAVP